MYRIYCNDGRLSSPLLTSPFLVDFMEKQIPRFARDDKHKGLFSRCLDYAHFGDDRHKLGHVNVDDGSLPLVALDVQAEVVAIEHVKPLAHIAQADAFDIDMGHLFFGNADTVVLDFDVQAPIAVGGAQMDLAALQPGCQPVLEAVLHDRLQQHAGNEDLQGLGADLLHDIEVVAAKARHFDVQIIVNEGKFLAERHKGFVLAQQTPQNVAQLQDHAAGAVRVNADQCGNCVERIEQKMWIDLA